MTPDSRPSSPGQPGKPKRILRIIAVATAVLFAVVPLSQVHKAGVPNAPAALLYGAVAVAALTLVLQLPIVFYRLSRRGRTIATLMLIITLVFSCFAFGAAEPAWRATPEGKQEAAETAKREQETQQAVAENDRQKAAEASRQQDEATAQKLADLEAQKPEMCNLAAQQAADGTKILEINNVTVESSTEPNEVLTCSGDAITSQGNMKIEFGFVQTPQGKTLLITRFP